MSIVTGIATAPGISALLNAPRERNPAVDAASGKQAARTSVDGASTQSSERGASSERPVQGIERAALARFDAAQGQIKDPRIARFVEAVQALRLTNESAAALAPGRLSDLRAAAKIVFKIENDIPREVRPSENGGAKTPPRADAADKPLPEQAAERATIASGKPSATAEPEEAEAAPLQTPESVVAAPDEASEVSSVEPTAPTGIEETPTKVAEAG